MNPAKIFFFIVRFLAIESLARKNHDTCYSDVVTECQRRCKDPVWAFLKKGPLPLNRQFLAVLCQL
jgi:hypothetical protein